MSPDATHRSSTKTYPRPSSDLARSAPPQRSRARQIPRAAVFSPRDESNCPAITGVETSIRCARDSPLEGDGFELPVPQQIHSDLETVNQHRVVSGKFCKSR